MASNANARGLWYTGPMMKTRAAVLYRLNEPLVIEELEVPALAPGQVLVRLAFTGLCQTQLLEIRGRKGPDAWLPHCLGHEGSGEVVDVGPDVRRVRAGDRVVLSWIKGEGANAPGAKYKNSRGETVNSGQVSTFQTLTVVSENRCTPIPAGLPLDVAALLGCAVPTGAGIVLNEMKAQAGKTLCVVGLGGIGLSAVMAGKMAGCSQVVAVDLQAEKLELALAVGANSVVLASDTAAMEKLVGTFDYVVEATGARAAMEMGFRLVKPGGGRLTIAGNLRHGETISIDPFDLIKGKQITGTAGGQTSPGTDFPKYAAAVQSGTMNLKPLISRVGKLEEINALFDALERREIPARALIQF